MKPLARVVETCTTCPFADDGSEMDDGKWTCHAEYTKKGWPKSLGGTRPPAKPPRWCALRKAPILVTLGPRS